jgi:hypothetical protein
MYTRVKIRVKIPIRFRAQFPPNGLRVLIIYHTPITTVCKNISEKIDPKFDCDPPLAHQIVYRILRRFVRQVQVLRHSVLHQVHGVVQDGHYAHCTPN